MSGFSDRVKDTSTTTGTGDFTLAGSAPTGFVTFGSAFAVGALVYYAISSSGSAEWEVGQCPLSGATTLQRSAGQVLASSNSGALVNFSAGTKDVYCDIPATFQNRLDSRGRALAANRYGAALP